MEHSTAEPTVQVSDTRAPDPSEQRNPSIWGSMDSGYYLCKFELESSISLPSSSNLFQLLLRHIFRPLPFSTSFQFPHPPLLFDIAYSHPLPQVIPSARASSRPFHTIPSKAPMSLYLLSYIPPALPRSTHLLAHPISSFSVITQPSTNHAPLTPQ